MNWNAPRPAVQLAGRPYCAFQVWGVAGYTSAAALAIGLAVRSALDVRVVLLLLLLAVAVFLGLAMATKLLLGVERLIYYHHEIAVLAASAAAVRAMGLQVAEYVDVAVVGLGTFLAFGRLGCAAVGCCYGKPASRGFVYGPAHVESGFPARFLGVRLVPVQWIESALVAALTAGAIYAIWRHAAPGTAFALYALGYALARFGLEFLRGDAARRYAWGFSTAQWTSAAIWVLVAVREPALACALPAAMLAIGVQRRRRGAAAAWFDAAHIDELADIVTMTGRGGRPRVLRTSAGLLLSSGYATIGCIRVEHYTVSTATRLQPDRVLRLAHLLARLRGRDGFDGALLEGRHGVVHLIRPAA